MNDNTDRTRTVTGRIRILVLGQAIRYEKRAVIAEERGADPTDLWARGRELRHEAGQHPAVIRAAPPHMRATVNGWRRYVDEYQERP